MNHLWDYVSHTSYIDEICEKKKVKIFIEFNLVICYTAHSSVRKPLENIQTQWDSDNIYIKQLIVYLSGILSNSYQTHMAFCYKADTILLMQESFDLRFIIFLCLLLCLKNRIVVVKVQLLEVHFILLNYKFMTYNIRAKQIS